MLPIRLALVGLGKIARDQHLPAIARTTGIDLVAVASRHASMEGLAHAPTLDALLREGPPIDAVALCTPPQGRYAQAAAALRAGKHVLLEKPPGATVGEVAPLVDLARSGQRTLFATWHSRFAPAVEPARRFLANRQLRSVEIAWREDVRRWHPGQSWIWQPGGLGVFDPGINALSIVTRILPHSLMVAHAELFFPTNREAPIAAHLDLVDAAGLPVRADFDWRQTGPQTWDIHVMTDDGRLTLAEGASQLLHDGHVLLNEREAEYAGIYRRFVDLVTSGQSDVDLAPLSLVADAFLLGRRAEVEPFVD